MDPALRAYRRERAVEVLVPLFAGSGATSLIYETLWERRLHLVFGTSQVAVATVLTAFMAGLALGGFASARIADRVRRPLCAYAILEGLIGAYALAFARLLKAVEPLYLGFWHALNPAPTVFAAFQFTLLALLLLPPTVCMGATLPLLARFATTRAELSGRRVSQLYGANTVGAVLGVGISGFYLMPRFGLAATTWVAAAGNAVVALVALLLARSVGEGETRSAEPVPPAAPLGRLAVVATLAGFASLLYEVAWFRLMVLVLGGSAYAFSIMLLAFLLGLGAGAWAVGAPADRTFSRHGRVGVVRLVAGLELGVAVSAWALMYLYQELPIAFVELYDALGHQTTWMFAGKLLLALLVMLPPALLMGAAFPPLVRVASGRSTALGRPVGRLYGWNTVGAIAGAALGSLWLLPRLKVRGTVLLALSVNLVAALLTAWPVSRRRRLAASAALVAIVFVHLIPPPWDPLLMTAGMYKYVSDLDPDERNRAGVMNFAVIPYELLFYEEGLSSVVTVARARKSGDIWLANNGKVDASSNIDMPTQVLVGHLPFVFARDPRRALVIGLASGVSAGAVTLHPSLRRIDIVEIEPAIRRASHFFDRFNHRPLDDPRVRLFTNDARNQLVLTPDATYDVAVSEPSNPWLSGVSNLFTREFFELGKRKLRPGGVWSQWVQMYGLSADDLRSLLGTFATVYPHVLLFSTIEDSDLAIVGSDAPLVLDNDAIRRILDAEPAVADDLMAIGVYGPEDLLARYQMNRPRILAFAQGKTGEIPLNTDDDMRIEFSAPLHLHESTSTENFVAMLGTAAESGGPAIPFAAIHDLEQAKALARAYARREDWVRALLMLKKADAHWPDDPTVLRMYTEFQKRLVAELNAEG